MDPTLADLRFGQVEPRERVNRDRWAKQLQLNTGRKVRCGGCEEIPAVKGARDDVERVVGVGKLVDGRDAAEPLGRRHEQAVVGADEETAVAALQRQRPARAADPRVDHGKMDAGRHVRRRIREHERALEHVLRRDPMRDVDDLNLGSDRLDDAVAGTNEVVLKAEVAQKGDEHAAERTTSGHKGRRGSVPQPGLDGQATSQATA